MDVSWTTTTIVPKTLATFLTQMSDPHIEPPHAPLSAVAEEKSVNSPTSPVIRSPLTLFIEERESSPMKTSMTPEPSPSPSEILPSTSAPRKDLAAVNAIVDSPPVVRSISSSPALIGSSSSSELKSAHASGVTSSTSSPLLVRGDLAQIHLGMEEKERTTPVPFSTPSMYRRDTFIQMSRTDSLHSEPSPDTRYFKIDKAQNAVVACSHLSANIIAYINPDASCQQAMHEYGITDAQIAMCANPDEVPSLFCDDHGLFVLTKRPRRFRPLAHQFQFDVTSIGLFLVKGRLIVILSEEIPLFYDRMFEKVSCLQEVMFKLIHESTVIFQEQLVEIRKCSYQITRAAGSSPSRELEEILMLQKAALLFQSDISFNGKVLQRLLKNFKTHKESAEAHSLIRLIEDGILENTLAYELAGNLSTALAGINGARSAIINNNLSDLMLDLNAVVIAIALPSFFAGVGGMSEFSRMIGYDADFGSGGALGYALFLLCMIVISILTYLFVKRMYRL